MNTISKKKMTRKNNAGEHKSAIVEYIIYYIYKKSWVYCVKNVIIDEGGGGTRLF
jgi:hypothetical protein